MECNFCGREINTFVNHQVWEILDNKRSCEFCFEEARKEAVEALKIKCYISKWEKLRNKIAV